MDFLDKFKKRIINPKITVLFLDFFKTNIFFKIPP